MALTKADIANYLVQKFSLNQAVAIKIIDLMFETAKKSLEIGEDVKISGFGNFVVRTKQERIGRNPKTKEECIISKRRVVTFKSGPKLKEKLNQSV